jgi:hypothetical protein
VKWFLLRKPEEIEECPMTNTDNQLERALRVLLITGFFGVLGVEAWLVIQALGNLH